MLDTLLSLISPHICCSCGETGTIICDNCIFDIKEHPFLRCIECLCPSIKSNLCNKCRKTVPYSDIWVVGERNESLKELIDDYKFHRKKVSYEPCARLLSARVPYFIEEPVVTYVPTIPSHKRQRGYDHMKLIAQKLSYLRGWKSVSMLEHHVSHTQHFAGRKERFRRQENSFQIIGPKIKQPILLIDDIYTTGATITAAVKALKAKTDQPVYVAIIARQMPKE